MEADPDKASINDRLSSTLFLAALAHGVVILGVTFTSLQLDDSELLPTLKVTLIADTNETETVSEDSDYLAQRNQRDAGGVAEGERPTTTLSQMHPTTQSGDPMGADLTDAASRDPLPSAEQVVSRGAAEQQLNALPEPTDMPAEASMTAAQLIQHDSPQTLAAELDLRAELPEVTDRELVASPSTRESMLAEYLDAWRRRVERIGTVNFPEQAHHEQVGRPTLEVAIGSDGRLEDIVVRRSSGDKGLDQAALTILRLAAPFEPLPEAIRAEYDVLRFAYEWDFSAGQSADSPGS